jgi:hypothetical protein
VFDPFVVERLLGCCRTSHPKKKPHFDDLANVLWRHIFLWSLHVAKLALVGIALGIHLRPLACLQKLRKAAPSQVRFSCLKQPAEGG